MFMKAYSITRKSNMWRHILCRNYDGSNLVEELWWLIIGCLPWLYIGVEQHRLNWWYLFFFLISNKLITRGSTYLHFRYPLGINVGNIQLNDRKSQLWSFHLQLKVVCNVSWYPCYCIFYHCSIGLNMHYKHCCNLFLTHIL